MGKLRNYINQINQQWAATSALFARPVGANELIADDLDAIEARLDRIEGQMAGAAKRTNPGCANPLNCRLTTGQVNHDYCPVCRKEINARLNRGKGKYPAVGTVRDRVWGLLNDYSDDDNVNTGETVDAIMALFPPAPTLPRMTNVDEFERGRDYKTPNGYMTYIGGSDGMYFIGHTGNEKHFPVFTAIYGPVPKVEVE